MKTIAIVDWDELVKCFDGLNQYRNKSNEGKFISNVGCAVLASIEEFVLRFASISLDQFEKKNNTDQIERFVLLMNNAEEQMNEQEMKA